MGEFNRDKDVRGFRAVNVFDISDTEPMDERGDIPDEPQWWGDNTPSETADELFMYASEVASDLGIKVTQSDAKGGEKGFAAGDHINISSDVSGAGRLSTMIHEIAHELMHFKAKSIFYQDDEVRGSSALKELQAESVSYVVLKHYGLPVSHHTTYLALWKANKEKIQSNLEVPEGYFENLPLRIQDRLYQEKKEPKVYWLPQLPQYRLALVAAVVAILVVMIFYLRLFENSTSNNTLLAMNTMSKSTITAATEDLNEYDESMLIEAIDQPEQIEIASNTEQMQVKVEITEY
jgi:hypothetical protein